MEIEAGGGYLIFPYGGGLTKGKNKDGKERAWGGGLIILSLLALILLLVTKLFQQVGSKLFVETIFHPSLTF